MADRPVVVFAQIQAKPGHESVLREELMGMVEATRAEEGCLQYDLHQSTEDPRLFLFYEVWATESHLLGHLETPHITRIMERAPVILDGLPVLTRCAKIA